MTNEFFVKNRRAQNDTDYESWASADVAATLNGFDNTGSVRATTLIIFYGNRVDDIRFQKGVINTLQARMGTGGNNMPMVLIEETEMQKDQNIVGTLQARDYKGVGNQYVEENKLVVETSVIPIHDKATRFSGKRKLHNGEYSMDGAGNGLGIGKDGDPMNTLTGGDRHAVVFSHTQGLDAQPSEEASPTLRANGGGMAIAYDEFNDSLGETHHTLRAGTKQSTGVVTSSHVRRLTPIECERLQGFPDDWTGGQSDTHRYKQMGNAVAVPVVDWIIGRLVKEHVES